MTDELQIKQDILECGRRLYDKRMVAANDGNISVRLSDNEIIATPTGRSKGFMLVDELVKIDLQGRVIEGSHRPSTEILMHLAIYNARPDAKAVVHAHPVYATGFATANLPLDQCVAAEIVTTLGSIPLARYGTPSTHELSDAVVDVMKTADACLMANHGVVTCGKNIFDAYYKLERVEHYANIIFVARMLGGEKILTREDVVKLDAIRSTYGTQTDINPGCRVCEDSCVGNDCSCYEKKDETVMRSLLQAVINPASGEEDLIRSVIEKIIRES
ncbi:class II aldolase/adducin family protein [bacterium]|nr:class II aldolase/adducin family protein [bacterium]